MNGWRAVRIGALGVVLAATIIAPVSAAPVHVFDQLAQVFSQAITPLQVSAATWSLTLFHYVVTLEFVWTAYLCLFQTSSVGEIVTKLTHFCVIFGLGSYLTMNQLQLSQQASAYLPTIAASFYLPGAASGASALTPGQMEMVGHDVAEQVADAEGNDPVKNFEVAIPSTIAGIGIQFAFLVIALELLAANVGLQFVFAIAGILLGFVGSRWTRPHAAKYVNMLISGGLLLIIINAVAGIGILVAGYITGMATTLGTDDGAGLKTDLETIASVGIALFFLAVSAPKIAAWLNASAPIQGASGAVLGAMNTVAGYGMGAGRALASGGSAGSASVASIEKAIDEAA